MKDFEPRLFQKEMFEKVKDAKFPLALLRPRGRMYYGIDVGQKNDDKTVIVRGIPNKEGGFSVISIDEFATYPNYKWWRNPIKWWNWRQLTRKWLKDSKFFEIRSTPKGKNLWKN